MISALEKLEQLTMGLTQQDQMFRDALEELSETSVNFYDNKQRAYTRLNHALVGAEADVMHPVKIEGVVEFEKETLRTLVDGEETTYAFDELDPDYIETMRQVATSKGLKPETEPLPLTDLAMDLLDELHADKELKPELAKRERKLNNTSQRNLQKAFENEMLFNVQLEQFISENGLEDHFDAHSDELSGLIGEKRFQSSFTDGLEHIDEEMNERAESKGLMGR